jgi:hypothetical protein
MTDWILQVFSAQMPASCRSRYVVIRVLEVDAGVKRVTSRRAKEVRRVVHESRPVPAAGTTDRSSRVRAMNAAQSMIADRLEKNLCFQMAIGAKLESGQRLTDAEYAMLA